MSNQYHDALQSSGAPMTAESLLAILRTEIQPVLDEWSEIAAPSDSARAMDAIRFLEKRIKESKESLGLSMAFMQATKSARENLRLLQRFMAVHETCWILEGRALI